MSSFTDFERLFEAMPHPYLIMKADAGFTIVAANERYLAATGTKRQNLLGRGAFEVFPDRTEDQSGSGGVGLRSSLQRVLRDRVQDVMGAQKYDFPHHDGMGTFEIKYWSPVNTPVLADDGSVLFIIHHVEDVTEQVRAQERAHPHDLNRTQTEFFAAVSHEFRTPLTLVLGPLEELLSGSNTALPERMHGTLEMVYRNSLRLLNLVNELLEFARLERHRLNPEWESTNLAALTTDLVSGFRPLCDEVGLALHVECAGVPEQVLVDRQMWERIVLNLVSNAFKFTFTGSIQVRLVVQESRIELSVADTGIGIPAAELPRLFERFHRIDSRRGRSYEGSGIGLALVKELATVLEGSVTVESVESQGTRFIVKIPLKLATAADVAASRNSSATADKQVARAIFEEAHGWLQLAQDEIAGEARKVARARILVVDDNADMRSYIRRRLEEAGFAVQTAVDGESAWEACQRDLPDLVLTDEIMPGMSGLELLEHVRRNPRTVEMPVILLSARAAEEARIEGVWVGADDYVVKPFPARELVARIQAVLHRAAERRRTQTELRRAAAVFTATNDAVIITDAEQRIVSVNDAFTRITGFSREEAIGKNPNLQKSGRQDTAFYQGLWQTLAATGQWQGEIWNRRKSGETYPAWENISAVKDERGELVNYVSVFSDIGSLKAAEERLAFMAHHDALTGLPNRLLFSARLDQSLEHASRSGKLMALLLLDLDRFKLINDTMGHAAGDKLLEAVALRLKHAVRAEDTVARLGGDEFAVVLHELTHLQDAALVAEKILGQVSAPVKIGQRDVTSSASIGISLYPNDAKRGDDLIKAADAAMYRAKRRGRHTFEFYSAELTAEAEVRLDLELSLPGALAQGELELHYQPQMELATNRIVGVEALLRWTHPTRGAVPPEQVIEIAEESGFIEQLGKWIIETATAQAIAWSAAGLPPLHLAINLSGRQLALEHLRATLQQALHGAQLAGCRVILDIELTETAIAAVESSAAVLAQLRALGAGIAIDDFGTGYSSLSRLKSLPIDILKIDRSFVRDIPKSASDCAITSAIISLGHELGLKLVAEGVEREEQLAFLRSRHCDCVQGFLICKPLTTEEITRFLKRRSPL